MLENDVQGMGERLYHVSSSHAIRYGKLPSGTKPKELLTMIPAEPSTRKSFYYLTYKH